MPSWQITSNTNQRAMAKTKKKVNKKISAVKKIVPKPGGGKRKSQPKRANGGKKSTKQKPDKVDVFDLFCYWVVRTPDERKEEKLPDAQQDFAKLHNVEQSTLSRWKSREDYEAARMTKMKDKLSGKTPEVIDALFKRITKYGMGYEVELWLAYVEGWDKKKVLELTGKVEFGDGDIRALIQHLPKTKQKIFYDTITKLLIEAETSRTKGEDIGNDGV